eukprot:jgi/Hompol1/962/HPOL_005474-RA
MQFRRSTEQLLELAKDLASESFDSPIEAEPKGDLFGISIAQDLGTSLVDPDSIESVDCSPRETLCEKDGSDNPFVSTSASTDAADPDKLPKSPPHPSIKSAQVEAMPQRSETSSEANGLALLSLPLSPTSASPSLSTLEGAAIDSATEALLRNRSLTVKEMDEQIPHLIHKALLQNRAILANAMQVYDISIQFSEVSQRLLREVSHIKIVQDSCAQQLEVLSQLKFEFKFRRQEIQQLDSSHRLLDLVSDLEPLLQECSAMEQMFMDTREECELVIAQLDQFGLLDPDAMPARADSSDDMYGEGLDREAAADDDGSGSNQLRRSDGESLSDFNVRRKFDRMVRRVRMNDQRIARLEAVIREQLPRNNAITGTLPRLATMATNFSMWSQDARLASLDIQQELDKIAMIRKHLDGLNRGKRRSSWPLTSDKSEVSANGSGAFSLEALASGGPLLAHTRAPFHDRDHSGASTMSKPSQLGSTSNVDTAIASPVAHSDLSNNPHICSSSQPTGDHDQDTSNPPLLDPSLENQLETAPPQQPAQQEPQNSSIFEFIRCTTLLALKMAT